MTKKHVSESNAWELVTGEKPCIEKWNRRGSPVIVQTDSNTPKLTADRPPLLVAILLTAMAAGMGWGIRGQYGHGTGAMIAGVLCGLTLVMLFWPRISSLAGAQAAALFTIAISFGGTMTYGQTVGLTHDGPLIGNWGALGWGMLGLAVKGGIWIGFAGLFLGMATSSVRYRSGELALLMWCGIFVLFLGVYIFNQPYDPENRLLPRIYFSDDWRWEPDSELKPRREIWGGLLMVLVAFISYAGIFKRDVLACRIGLWAVLAGALGFPAGQCVQAFHAWNPEFFQQPYLSKFTQYFNWWNMMETTFGVVFGSVLALGLWRNWDHICAASAKAETPEVVISPLAEIALVVLHIAAVLVWNLGTFPMFGSFAGLALTMAIIPVAAISGGRLWPYLMLFPVVLAPIAAKTVRELSVRNQEVPMPAAILAFVVAPVLVAIVVVAVSVIAEKNARTARTFAARALLFTVWIYFFLNWAFFRSPWPSEPWTGRTPNGIIFAVCAMGLSIGAGWYWWRSRDDRSGESEAETPTSANAR